jgi:hypothetical protein
MFFLSYPVAPHLPRPYLPQAFTRDGSIIGMKPIVSQFSHFLYGNLGYNVFHEFYGKQIGRQNIEIGKPSKSSTRLALSSESGLSEKGDTGARGESLWTHFR